MAYLPFDKKNWIAIVQKIKGRWWNADKKYWELPYVQDTIDQLKQIKFVHFNFVVSATIPLEIPVKTSQVPQISIKKQQPIQQQLNKYQQNAVKAFEEMLILERKSWRTIKSYKANLIGLCFFYPNTKPSLVSNEQIKKYLLHKITIDKIHENTHGQILNALVAFYKRLLKQEGKLENLTRPKKPKDFPNVFSTSEIELFLGAIDNLKHKTMMILTYSSGLRKSEVINLRRKDILFERKCIFVKAAKGKKDRYVLLAEKSVEYIKRYLELYEPKYWLFEGQTAGQYGESSIQSVFTAAKIKANINPYVTFHGLRHSFATHLVENNVPIHVVKELLGHMSIQTTEIYLHISDRFRKDLKSPLDSLTF